MELGKRRIWDACPRQPSPSQPGCILPMLELCQGEAFPGPEGSVPRRDRRRHRTAAGLGEGDLEKTLLVVQGEGGVGKNRVWGGTLETWRRFCPWAREKVGWEKQDLGSNIRALEKILSMGQGEGGMGRGA